MYWYIYVYGTDTAARLRVCRRYGYDWKIAEAEKNLMRTHTTAVSARMLYKIAQQVRARACMSE